MISPHLDDAVFSCGGLLQAHPGSTVITVCTGLPDRADRAADWDRRCGFATAAQAMEGRMAEEREALRITASAALGLGFLDSQYRQERQANISLLADRLLHALVRVAARRVALPLGLFHDDHISVSEAGLRVWRICPRLSWFLYEDVPYRARAGAVRERLAQLEARGIAIARARLNSDLERKAQAVMAYASQLRGLGGLPASAAQPEGYWRIVGPGAPG
ncbi:PIG-L deacetylase family protein [Achromobacter sp. K91]|uniref:PIG-L deacetylase family protein n=1 Tax=Achromobacter sp. K91 TaxID=2292262 RepID=UPI001313F75B|nr:PIG-L family deacetylase [Achromobacter sp. K91]